MGQHHGRQAFTSKKEPNDSSRIEFLALWNKFGHEEHLGGSMNVLNKDQTHLQVLFCFGKVES